MSGESKRTDYRVTTEMATVYRVRSAGGFGEWADASVRSWPGGGQISIQSSFGTFAHSWNAIGDRSFTAFLRALHFDYFMTKTRDADYREFDLDTTVAAIRKAILEARREKSLDKEQAREAWEEIDGLATCSDDEFKHTLYYHGKILERVFGGDWLSVPLGSRKNVSCVRFWEELWPALCAAWEAETEAVAA